MLLEAPVKLMVLFPLVASKVMFLMLTLLVLLNTRASPVEGLIITLSLLPLNEVIVKAWVPIILFKSVKFQFSI